jgi:hypothetical protein
MFTFHLPKVLVSAAVCFCLLAFHWNASPLLGQMRTEFPPSIDSIPTIVHSAPVPRLSERAKTSLGFRPIAWVFKTQPFQALNRGCYFITAERFFNDNQIALGFGLGITRSMFGINHTRNDFREPTDDGLGSTGFVTGIFSGLTDGLIFTPDMFYEYYEGAVKVNSGLYCQATAKYYFNSDRFGPGHGAIFIGLYNFIRNYNWRSRISYDIVQQARNVAVTSEQNNAVIIWQFVPTFGRSWVTSGGFFIESFMGIGVNSSFNNYYNTTGVGFFGFSRPISRQHVTGIE